MKLPCVSALMVAVAANACASPSPYVPGRNPTTSCATNVEDGNPDPTAEINPLASNSVSVGQTVTLTACFRGDLKDPAGVAAIQWMSLDPAIATVSPSMGQLTNVRGISFGVTRVRAVIKGSPFEVEIRVCQNAQVCPPKSA